ncbi:hypothetical protein EDC25_102242 [Pseudofulvimonas gallinarii]|uniref:Uncharacterized protein n=1 Tax=Pseudofulvimonas gallinarii TaxID=634155 RepID=A0A4R3LKS6_9GAMM|nr:hypothetical protein EDC25_102242 [Pseudofulvimonas gallinarii]
MESGPASAATVTLQCGTTAYAAGVPTGQVSH